MGLMRVGLDQQRGYGRDEPGRAASSVGRWLMANKGGHRRFGNIRKLASGRYQASYIGPDGFRRNAPTTFARELMPER